MTIDISKIKDRLSKITYKKWYIVGPLTIAKVPKEEWVDGDFNQVVCYGQHGRMNYMEVIAHAPTDIADLLEHIEELEGPHVGFISCTAQVKREDKFRATIKELEEEIERHSLAVNRGLFRYEERIEKLRTAILKMKELNGSPGALVVAEKALEEGGE